MGRIKKSTTPINSKKRPPASTVEGRENQMIALAVDLAEQQLRDGTASSQVITHYLKLGSTKERLEKEMMEEQKKLLKAKTENLQSVKNMENLYAQVIESMKKYRRTSDED